MATTHVSALSSGVNLVMQKDYFTQDNVTPGTALPIFTGYWNAIPVHCPDPPNAIYFIGLEFVLVNALHRSYASNEVYTGNQHYIHHEYNRGHI